MRKYMSNLQKNKHIILGIMFLCASVCFGVDSTFGQNGSGDGTTEFTTSNGVKVIHRQIKGNEVVSIQVYFKGGAKSYSEKNAGIENLALDVATQGTKNFSKSRINRDLAGMGTIVGAAGGYDFGAVEMKCVRRNFERSWQLLADIILNPAFDEKEITLEKDKVINLLKQQNDLPEIQVDLLSKDMLYASHPYINSPAGTIQSVSGLTAAGLKAYHAKLLETSKMLVVVVGNIAQDELKTKIEAAFGKLPRGDYKNGVPQQFPKASQPEFKIESKSVPTNYIRGTFAAPSMDSPDYPAFYVTTNILAQLMFQEVRVKKNLTYNVDASLLTNTANSGYIVVTTGKPNETIRIIFDQIEFLKRNTLRDDGLKVLISGMLTKYYSDLETNDAQAGKLAEYELMGGGWKNLAGWLGKVEKVTAADVQRVANTYFKNFHFAAVGDASQFDKSLFLEQ